MNADVKLPVFAPLFRTSLNINYFHGGRRGRGRWKMPLPYASVCRSSSSLKWGSVIRFYEQLQHLLNIAMLAQRLRHQHGTVWNFLFAIPTRRKYTTKNAFQSYVLL